MEMVSLVHPNSKTPLNLVAPLLLAAMATSLLSVSASLRLTRRLSPTPRLLQPISPLPSLSTSNSCRQPSWVTCRARLGIRFVGCAAKNGGGEVVERTEGEEEEEEMMMRGQSTMPERFRHLTREVPDRPVRWPWAIPLVFLVYAWRSVLWELTNWRKAVLAIFSFFAYLFKLVLALIFHIVGDPLTGLIRCIEFALYSACSIYMDIVAFAPVPELTRIILFTSTVLAIAEATVPDAVSKQPYILTVAGIIGFGAVKGVIPELLFWFLLLGMFCYSSYAKKRDAVSSALPSAAVLTAVGEPWVRGLTMASYLALAIVQHSRLSEEQKTSEIPANSRRLPLPLLLAALAIGINIAAKWVRHRHLTWMIV